MQTAQLKLTIQVSEKYARVRDVAELITTLNSIYETLARTSWNKAVPRAHGQRLPDDLLLQITSIHSGSDIKIDLLGLDKVIEQLSKLLQLIRDWKLKKQNLREKVEQERQKTSKMKLQNLKDQIYIVAGLPLSEEEKYKLYRKILKLVEKIERNRNPLLPGYDGES
jgi:hypothetical protein